MSKKNGFNPMRWNCNSDGCFNKKRRPKLEVFADCFPGKINFGDVDGLVDIQGAGFGLLEWKGAGGKLLTAQRIAFQNFTRLDGNIVFVANGDAETMNVTSYSTFFRGTNQGEIACDLNELKRRMAAWASWVSDKETV